MRSISRSNRIRPAIPRSRLTRLGRQWKIRQNLDDYLWTSDALRDHLQLPDLDGVTVFAMHEWERADLPAPPQPHQERCIVHHERALIREEEFERRHASVVHHPFHILSDIITPACDRHVEAIVHHRRGCLPLV